MFTFILLFTFVVFFVLPVLVDVIRAHRPQPDDKPAGPVSNVIDINKRDKEAA